MDQPDQPKARFSIRPVRASDAEAIWHITRQAGVIETIMSMPSDRIEQRERTLAALTPDDHWFVAEVNGTVVGLAGLRVASGRRRHAGHLFLFVARDHQRQGIGAALLETLLDVADSWLLLRRVELTVLAENEHARRLYERHGFVVEGTLRQNIISEGTLHDEYAMARLREP